MHFAVMLLAAFKFFGAWAGVVLAVIGLVGLFALKLQPEKRSELRWHGRTAMSRSSIAIIASAMLLCGGEMVAKAVTELQISDSAFEVGAVVYGIALAISAFRDHKARKDA
jgi:hypothetical protein